ncbi:uncharacterized protein LOC141884581 isoform X1 [Acropora palmata]|uniref:uncharacterized protein LOC141884581 isoform X1 n=1 Tax=Acropora palmata TaxID=6131 RepID=UPI003DA0EA3F
MQTIRRGKFGTFHRATSVVRDTFDDNENSITSSQDGEVCVEVSVGPKGDILQPDVELVGGSDDPFISGNPGLFIVWIKPGSEAHHWLKPGYKITKIDDINVTNVSCKEAENLFRLADQHVKICAVPRSSPDEVSSNSKIVSWGEESWNRDIDSNSDSGRGTEIFEKEPKTNLDAAEKINIKVPAGPKGVLSPLDFEIKGGRDDPSPDGETKFLIKEIKEGSFLHKHGIKVGDQILKVEGVDLSNVPQHVFFNLLRAANKVAKIQVLKIPTAKDDTEIRVYKDTNRGDNEVMVELSTGPKGRLGNLGLKIKGGRDRPVVPGDPGIFITAVRRGSLLQKVIGPGDKILKIDDMNTLNVPLMFALDKIRSADRRVRLHIKKAEKDENDVSKRDRKKTAYRDAKTFTEEQLEEFRTAFCVFDRSGTGKISLSQVIELCRSLGYNLTAIDRDIIYTEFRLAGERRISFLNFISIIKNVTLSKQSNTDLFNAFEIFDGENTGFFKVDELEKALKEMPQGKQVNENEIADILAMADPDGDGQVSFQEFKKLVLPTFHQY